VLLLQDLLLVLVLLLLQVAYLQHRHPLADPLLLPLHSYQLALPSPLLLLLPLLHPSAAALLLRGQQSTHWPAPLPHSTPAAPSCALPRCAEPALHRQQPTLALAAAAAVEPQVDCAAAAEQAAQVVLAPYLLRALLLLHLQLVETQAVLPQAFAGGSAPVGWQLYLLLDLETGLLLLLLLQLRQQRVVPQPLQPLLPHQASKAYAIHTSGTQTVLVR
jgi:hypothetical protein